MNTIDAMKQALAMIGTDDIDLEEYKQVTANLRNAIEQMEKVGSSSKADSEPVAWMYRDYWSDGYRTVVELAQYDHTFRSLNGEYIKGIPLYTHPAPAMFATQTVPETK